MCFQVSDVTITSPQIRRAVLGHALLSFAYNTVILALALNLTGGAAAARGRGQEASGSASNRLEPWAFDSIVSSRGGTSAVAQVSGVTEIKGALCRQQALA